MGEPDGWLQTCPAIFINLTPRAPSPEKSIQERCAPPLKRRSGIGNLLKWVRVSAMGKLVWIIPYFLELEFSLCS